MMMKHQPCQLCGCVLWIHVVFVVVLLQPWLGQEGTAGVTAAFVPPSSRCSFNQHPQQLPRTTIISCPYRKHNHEHSHPPSNHNDDDDDDDDDEKENEKVNHHRFSSPPRSAVTASSSSQSSLSPPLAPPISIQSLEISNPNDVLLQTQLIPPSLQLWLHACTTTIETSDIAWLQRTTNNNHNPNNSRMGDVLQISPLALAQELWSSLTTTPTMPEVSLQDRMRFQWEHQSALLRSLYDDDDDDDNDDDTTTTTTTTTTTKSKTTRRSTVLLQDGQSNTHPLGYRLMVLPSHTRIPLAVIPALEATTVLYGTLCIQALQDSIPPEPSLTRPLHLSIGTPLSSMSSPPTDSDLQIVATYLQDQPVPPRHHGSSSSHHDIMAVVVVVVWRCIHVNMHRLEVWSSLIQEPFNRSPPWKIHVCYLYWDRIYR